MIETKMQGTNMMQVHERPKSSSNCCVLNFLPKNNTDVDALLVEELKELTVDEREKVYEDIHGVTQGLEETPEMIQKSLERLTQELAKSPRRKRKAYDRAVFLKPNLESDAAFQLRFLRADSHDAVKAAARMCSFFESKRDLFGDDKVAKTITLEDLDEDSMGCLRTGAIRWMKNTDQSGRRIIVSDLRQISFRDWRHYARYQWYMFMRSTDDETQQIKGAVNVSIASGLFSADMFSLTQKVAPILKDVPIRFAAIHTCFDNPSIRPLLSLFQVLVGSHIRLRSRTHFGSNLETQYTLLTFGIRLPAKLFESDKEERDQAIEEFLKERARVEASEAAREAASIPPTGICTFTPASMDVLVGRGRPYHTFPGSVNMTEMVEEYRARYMASAERYDKTIISAAILNAIKAQGGRFLQRAPEKGGWMEVDDAISREKVCQALRSKTKPMVLTERSSVTSSSSTQLLDNFKSTSPVGSPKAKRVRHNIAIIEE